MSIPRHCLTIDNGCSPDAPSHRRRAWIGRPAGGCREDVETSLGSVGRDGIRELTSLIDIDYLFGNEAGN